MRDLLGYDPDAPEVEDDDTPAVANPQIFADLPPGLNRAKASKRPPSLRREDHRTAAEYLQAVRDTRKAVNDGKV